ncbi:DUF960 domain-containing protein [uncultured Ruminococcus sp.]|uniref:DUF960 domain-containing protein n=1 Tax=uncultured Ruminococcus sp. TaxID=165186 RepID=UPI00261497EA|nr:DUF960 domain-containing protein [uncultured Ruminococcus sp.]
MFSNKRYLTIGVQTDIPFELQLFMWGCIDKLATQRDYFQVFKLEVIDGRQYIRHSSEQPEYSKDYLIYFNNPVNQKVYVIDDCDHSTMLLAEEY